MMQPFDTAEIYRLYCKDLYRYLLYMGVPTADVEDVAQNSFLKAFQARSRFRGASSVKTWLFSIARNEAVDHLKKAARTATCEELEEGAEQVYVEDVVCSQETRNQIWAFISGCEEPKRSLLVLRLFDELSFPEIAALLERSEVWCRVTYMRLKNTLIGQLEEKP